MGCGRVSSSPRQWEGGSISSSGWTSRTRRPSGVPAPTRTPGCGSGSTSSFLCPPTWGLPAWLASRLPPHRLFGFSALAPPVKLVPSIKFPPWEILSAFHFPARTSTATCLSGIFVSALEGQSLNAKCFIVTKLLFKKLIPTKHDAWC